MKRDVAISVRVPKVLKAEIKRMARRDRRSLTSMVEKLLADGVARLQQAA